MNSKMEEYGKRFLVTMQREGGGSTKKGSKGRLCAAVNATFAGIRYHDIATDNCYDILTRMFVDPTSQWSPMIADVLFGSDTERQMQHWSRQIRKSYESSTLRRQEERRAAEITSAGDLFSSTYDCTGCFTKDIKSSLKATQREMLGERRLRKTHFVVGERRLDKNTVRLYVLHCTDARCHSSQQFLHDVQNKYGGMV